MIMKDKIPQTSFVNKKTIHDSRVPEKYNIFMTYDFLQPSHKH